MAKAKKSNMSMFVMLGAALLGVVAILLLLAPAVSLTGKVSGKTFSFNGFKLMFGGDIDVEGFKIGEMKFNFVAFLGLIFAVAGLVGALLSALLKMKFGGFMAIAGFLLAGIFFFLFKAVLPMNFENGKDTMELLEAVYNVKLGAGAIVAGILSILSALMSGAATFVLK